MIRIACSAAAVAASLLLSTAAAQTRFAGRELSINGFRNPSIGLEYQVNRISVHAGFYPTILATGTDGRDADNSFARVGGTYWLLPFGERAGIPSSFYVSASYLYGTARTPAIRHGALLDAGVRVYVWSGLHVRLGAAWLLAGNGNTYLNPTPGIGYSLRLR